MLKNNISSPASSGRLIRFLSWTLGFSWGFWGLSLLLEQVWPGNPLRTVLMILGSFGPAAGAKAALSLSFKELWRAIFASRRKSWPALLVFMGLELGVYVLAGQGWNPERSLLSLPLLFAFVLICGGGNEEIGWRGYLQPALEQRFSFPVATVLTGLAWTFWHLPLWLIPGSSQAGTSLPLFALDVILISFVFAGLYKRTRSVWYCALLHAFNNVIAGSFISPSQPIYFAGISLMAACAAYVWYQTQKKENQS